MQQRILAEFMGTAFLLIGVVGSGIMAATLTSDVALALLANAVATGCVLYVIITVLGPISGAHFNPVVTLYFLGLSQISGRVALVYIVAQITGGILGVWLSHLMFDLSIFQSSTTARFGTGQWSAEIIATFGLLFVIAGGLRHAPASVPTLVAIYITGAYWFTASTSFANPAVTVARAFTDTFAGIQPGHAPFFIAAQIAGLLLAIVCLPRLFAASSEQK